MVTEYDQLPYIAMAVAFARAILARDENTAGAIVDALANDKATMAAVLVGLVESARYAAPDYAEALGTLHDQLQGR